MAGEGPTSPPLPPPPPTNEGKPALPCPSSPNPLAFGAVQGLVHEGTEGRQRQGRRRPLAGPQLVGGRGRVPLLGVLAVLLRTLSLL
jgi:hypothetical protein